MWCCGKCRGTGKTSDPPEGYYPLWEEGDLIHCSRCDGTGRIPEPKRKTMRVLISAGSIPARLDSVKYVGNRFRGGLALKTAHGLYRRGIENITIVKWRHNTLQIDSRFNVVNVDDVLDYYNVVVDPDNRYDAYILACAVANLMPETPWEGKFPSHDYKEGDSFDIKFKISPRIIDHIAEAAPRTTLIGYKLFDGSEGVLVRAAKEVQRGSRANVIFANAPQWAKERKLVVMPDGSVIPCTFDEHIDWIARMLRLEWFQTKVHRTRVPALTPEEATLVETYPRTQDGDRTFGTFAFRKGKGFITTTRGKRNRGHCYVTNVDFENRVVSASSKATLNAPALAHIFANHPECNVILHDHKRWPGFQTVPYTCPGTTEDLPDVRRLVFWGLDAMGNPHLPTHGINVEHHGYFVCFDSAKAMLGAKLLKYAGEPRGL